MPYESPEDTLNLMFEEKKIILAIFAYQAKSDYITAQHTRLHYKKTMCHLDFCTVNLPGHPDHPNLG